MIQTIDHIALLPVYLAGGTAVLALLADLTVARRQVTIAITAAGAAAVVVAATLVGRGPARDTFCLLAESDACSYRADATSAVMAVLFGLLTLGTLGLSGYAARSLPAGEYCFLLTCSMTGGVALAYSRDLITLIVAVETLTLPLYALVGLRRRAADAAQGAVTFLLVSVVATTVTLLGAALLYSATGAVHFGLLADALGGGVPDPLAPLATVGAVVLVAGLAFKVAAVPFHAWAPAAYDGAPLPVAAYLSTASKLGGVVAVVYVVTGGLRPALAVVGIPLAAMAVLTMTVGNLVALRQHRMVRLLAWSSVAQAGYILAPLGAFGFAAGRTDQAVALAVTAALAYAIFFVVIEFSAFGSVIALRGSAAAVPAAAPTGVASAAGADEGGPDGGTLADYRGAARRAPLVGAAFTLALIGLAGLPPGLAGLFAKVAVVRSVLAGGAGWLAVIVAVNAVIGLAYYLRVAAGLYATTPPSVSADEPGLPDPPGRPGPAYRPRLPWPVAATLFAATMLAVVIGFAPQLVLDAAALVTP